MFTTQSSEGKNQGWRYVATILATLVAFAVGHIPLVATVTFYAKRGGLSDADLDRVMATGDMTQIGASSNLALLVMLLPFVFALAALLLCVRFLHVRSVRSVLTSRPQFDLKRVSVAAVLWFAVAGGGMLWAMPDKAITYQFSFAEFLPLLIIALVFLPLQVAAEEVLFRGYILQGVARVFSRPIWPLLIVTIVFAAVHLANPEFRNGFVFVAPIYLLLSLYFGILTVLDGGLEQPIGAHLSNNLFTALILSTSDGAMNTPAVFQTQVSVIVQHMWVLLLAIPVVVFLQHMIYRFDWAHLTRVEKWIERGRAT